MRNRGGEGRSLLPPPPPFHPPAATPDEVLLVECMKSFVSPSGIGSWRISRPVGARDRMEEEEEEVLS